MWTDAVNKLFIQKNCKKKNNRNKLTVFRENAWHLIVSKLINLRLSKRPELKEWTIFVVTLFDYNYQGCLPFIWENRKLKPVIPVEEPSASCHSVWEVSENRDSDLR